MSAADLVYALAWPPAWAFAWTAFCRALRLGVSRSAFGEAWAIAGFGVVIAYVVAAPWWPGAVIGAAHIAVGAWLWRRGGRGRRRAPRAYGAKSRALVAALAAKARDAARPRPVLRPVPGAAR